MSVLTVVGVSLALATCAAAQMGPAIVVRPPAYTVAWTSQTVRFTCVGYGNPLPTITWTDPDGNIVTGVTPSVQVSAQSQTIAGKSYRVSTIKLCGVQTSMTGQYSCTATGGTPGSSSIASNLASFFLQVSAPDTDAPAVVVKPPATTTVNEKSIVEFVCIAYGKPSPVITWSRTNVPNITSDTVTNANVTTQMISYGDVVFKKSVLQLCSVSRSDQDSTYMCKADNGISGSGIAANWANFGLAVNPLSTSSSSSSSTSTPTPSSSSQNRPLENLASETAYQATVGIFVVIVVVLIGLIAITCVWMIMIYKKGKEEVTLRPAPSRAQPAFNPTFGDEDEEDPEKDDLGEGNVDDEAMEEVENIDNNDDKQELVS